MLNIILFGAPGSGKGTQSKILLQNHQLEYISMGDILRQQIAQQTPLGLEAKALIDKGQLVPDDLIIKILEKRMAEAKTTNGFLFDGYPRTLAQAEILEQLLTKMGTSLSYFISLEVPEDELTKRLLNRAKIEGRSDDTKEVIEQRFKEYEAKTKPVKDYFAKKGKMIQIVGTGTEAEVAERLDNILCR
ncbi:MAG: adenylate kinase [Bacteroidales bacterium]|nr:adenylate kinase [Bacteroidales bacterium]